MPVRGGKLKVGKSEEKPDFEKNQLSFHGIQDNVHVTFSHTSRIYAAGESSLTVN